jgi:hypothetical protein
MTDVTPDLERMLQRALRPVDPPSDFALRLEATLEDLTDLAAEELDNWELGAMNDPRTWLSIARPVAAVAVGGAAGTALVVLRVRAGRRKRKATARDPLAYASQTARAVAAEARRVVRRR